MPNELVTSLSYVSTARPDLAESDFRNILNEANQRNEELGLTGLLAFNGLNFMQILEGSRDSVNCCIRLIDTDPRHDGMVIFDRRETRQRQFPDWKMAGILVHQKGEDIVPELDKLLSGEGVEPETRKHFNSFQSFGTQAE